MSRFRFRRRNVLPSTRLQRAFSKVAEALEELGEIIDVEAKAAAPKSKNRPTKRQVIREILEENPRGLTIYELIDYMGKKGYRFSGANPVNAVRAWLYKQPEFECDNSVFRLRKPVGL